MLNSAKQYKRNKDKDQEARMMEKARIRKSCSRLHANMSSLSARHWTALTAWIIAVCSVSFNSWQANAASMLWRKRMGKLVVLRFRTANDV